ncbi:retrotransposon protein, putative, ty1-copia subclass [Tanacetum coccineum]
MTGHWKRNCPLYLEELRANKKKSEHSAAGSGNLFAIELFNLTHKLNLWVYDTGCGINVCNTCRDLMLKVKTSLLGINICIWARVAQAVVEAIGTLIFDFDLLARLACKSVNVKVFWIVSMRIHLINANLYFLGDDKETFYIAILKRATALLGSIHSDVCWSHLRHVSRKVFKAEVELQLGKKIKALRSDRGGEYLSQSFKDDLVENDMVRSMFNLTTLPLSFWDYALESAVRILNMVPTKKVDKTPYEIWHGNRARILDRPPNAKGSLGVRGYTRRGLTMDGKYTHYKACLVAKAALKTYGIDYEETFSPVADIRAIRILIAIAAYYDYEIWQMDVKTAFLNGRLDEDIYMEQPEGYVDPKFPNGVCKLQRAIYGLKQASRQWNKRFDEEIKRFRVYSKCDEPCVYSKDSGVMLESCRHFWGIKIYRDRSMRLIGLNQSAYIDKILKKFNMQNSKKGFIPMEVKHDLSNEMCASSDEEKAYMKRVPYASAVGSIMYVVRCTRPDVAFAQNLVSRYQQNPGKLHWVAVKRLPRVSCGIRKLGAVDWEEQKQTPLRCMRHNLSNDMRQKLQWKQFGLEFVDRSWE